MLSKELLPGARPHTPCHFVVQFAVRPHLSYQTKPLSWWSPAILPKHGRNKCPFLALTDVFLRQFAGIIEQNPPRRPTRAAAEAAETQVNFVECLSGRKFRLTSFRQFPNDFLEQFQIQTSGGFSVVLSYPVRDTPPYRAIPFRDSIAEGGVAPIYLVFIGYRGGIAEIPFLRGGGGYRTSTSHALQGGKRSEKGEGGIALNWPC